MKLVQTPVKEETASYTNTVKMNHIDTNPAGKSESVTLTHRSLPLYIAALLGIYFALVALHYDPKPQLGDNHHYIALAKAIMSGRGFSDIYKPEPTPHMHFPPGYPVMLAGLLSLFPDNIQAIKLFSAFCGALFLAGAMVLLWGRLAPALLFAALIAAVLNPMFLMFSHSELSELPFMAIMIWAIICLTVSPEDAPLRRFVPGVALLALDCYVRTAGMFILPGVAIYLIFRRAWLRLAIFIAISFLALVPWMVRNSMIKAPSDTYAEHFAVKDYIKEVAGDNTRMATAGDISKRYLVNVAATFLFEFPGMTIPQTRSWLFSELQKEAAARGTNFTGLARSLVSRPAALPILAGTLLIIAMPIVLGILLMGFTADFRANPNPMHFITVIYIGLICLCPSAWFVFRLFLPVVIFLWVYFVSGIQVISRRRLKAYRAAPFIITCALIILSAVDLAPEINANIRNNIEYLHGHKQAGLSAEWADFNDAILWMRDYTPSDSRVLSRKPAHVFIDSGRTGQFFPYTTDRRVMYKAILDSRIDYVIDDRFDQLTESRTFLAPAIKEAQPAFSPVYRAARGHAVIYHVDREQLNRFIK